MTEKRKRKFWRDEARKHSASDAGEDEEGRRVPSVAGCFVFFFYILDSKVEGETAMFKRTNGG